MHQQVSFIWSIACIVLVIGELFYGIGSIRSKEILSDLSNVSPFLINGIQMFYGGILLLIASIIVEQPNVTVLTSWVYNGLFYISYLSDRSVDTDYITGSYQKTNPVFPSTWLYVSPLIAIIVGYIVLGEPLNPTMGMGACLILIGVFLANRSTLRTYFKKGGY